MNEYVNGNINCPYIIESVTGDVNGDGVPDFIYLTGCSSPDTPFIQNITVVIHDGRTGRVVRIEPKENQGYQPTLFLGDFTGDGVDDILLSIYTGGSGATMYHYIYTDLMNQPRMIFDFEQFNEDNQYSVNYMDNARVKVVDKSKNKTFIIDISYKGKDYLDEIYDENGKLKEPIEGFVNPISGLYPVDFDYNGTYELLIYQKIAGRYNADAIGYILSYVNWDNDRFNVYDRQVVIFGSDDVS